MDSRGLIALAAHAPPPDLVVAPGGVAAESEQAARWRLERLRPSVPGLPDDAPRFIGGNSNDAWLLGDVVLRVCWRADRMRLLREATVLESLPAAVPHARLLGAGLVDGLSWTVCSVSSGRSTPELTPADVAPTARELAGILGALHAWAAPAQVLAALDAVDDAEDGWSAYGRQLVPFRPAAFRAVAALVRRLPHVPPDVVDAALDRFAALLPHQPRPDEPAVVVHGDPLNVLVDGGRITALLDFEWVRRGPADLELVVPLFLAHWWPGLAAWPRLLAEHLPHLAGAPDHRERMWLYALAFALRGVLWWPPDGPEDALDPTHHLHLLRHLVDQPLRSCP